MDSIVSLEGPGDANFVISEKDLDEACCSKDDNFLSVQIEDISSDEEIDKM